MLADLKFVQGSVAKKDLLPALTHFVVENGTVRGYNGTLALCSPIPFDIACKPKAEQLVRAIGNCDDAVSLAMTPAGRLSVKSGKFKAFVDCVDGVTPHVVPTGQPLPVDGETLLAALAAVAPFIGQDASRPWCNGVLLRGPSVFATNNIVLVEFWAGETVAECVNLPRAAVKEMLRIGQPPVRAQVDTTSITFHYEGGRWLRTQLLSTEWPDLSRVLDGGTDLQPVPVPDKLFDGLHTIKPFADKLNRVLIKPGVLSTHETEGEGSTYEIEGFDHTGIYSIEMLELLSGVAKTADFSRYPKPCYFFGDRLRGAIVGMRAV